MSYIIPNVEILYPRINQPYRFDSSAGERGKSVPCDAFDDGAKYEVKFRMTGEQAKTLYGQMATAYQGAKEKGWPDKLPNPFEKEEEGTFVGKAVLKAAYGKDATEPPKQFDAKSKELPEDFKLTTGSIGNIAVTFYPYKMAEAGVSIRLRAVQVIKYVPMEAASPFSAVEGGFQFSTEDNPFEVVAPAAPAEAVTDELFGDDEPAQVEEPKKVVKKKAPAPKAPDDALADIVADWDD
jgi:hypothetical protein